MATNKSKFEIHSEDLQVALALIEPFIRSRSSRLEGIEILDTVLLEIFYPEGVIRFTASDLEATCKTYTSIKKTGDKDNLAIAIPGKSLVKLQRLFDGVVKFRSLKVKGIPKLEARFGKSTTTFNVLDANAFPKAPNENVIEPIMTFDRSKMEQVLKEVLSPAKGANDARPNLQNIYFDIKVDKNRVNIFSTNGIELSLNVFFPTSLMSSSGLYVFSFHHKSVRKLIHALHRIRAEIIEFHLIDEGKVMLFLAPHEAMIYFLANLSAIEQMPEYEKIVVKEHGAHIEISLDNVRTFLKRALLLEAHTMSVSHKTDDSFIRFFAETGEYGRTEASYYAQIMGEREFEIMLSPKRLSNLLGQFPRDGTLIMKLKKKRPETSPVGFELKENPAAQMILMPMTK